MESFIETFANQLLLDKLALYGIKNNQSKIGKLENMKIQKKSGNRNIEK